MQHRHRFGRSGAFVEQRHVGEIHRGQVRHHRLEVEQRFQTALRDLGLVRRIRGVPRGVLEHVAQDHGRRDRVVVAEPDERREHLVAIREPVQTFEHLGLGHRVASRERLVLADRVRHGRVDERGQRLVAERAEHVFARGRVESDVTIGERRLGVLRHLGSPLGPRVQRPSVSDGAPPLSWDLRDSQPAHCEPVLSPSVSPGGPGLLSRGASLRRFGCLRVSGEVAPSAPGHRCRSPGLSRQRSTAMSERP